MALTNISAYRLAGHKLTDADFDNNAEIEISKLGTRTLYKTIPANEFVFSGSASAAISGIFGCLALADGGSSVFAVSFKIPDEWESGNITARLLWNSPATSGDVEITLAYSAKIKGEDLTSATASTTVTDTAKGTTLLLNEMTFTLTGTNFAAGDYVALRFSRDPASGPDTLGDVANIFAVSLEFTGRG